MHPLASQTVISIPPKSQTPPRLRFYPVEHHSTSPKPASRHQNSFAFSFVDNNSVLVIKKAGEGLSEEGRGPTRGANRVVSTTFLQRGGAERPGDYRASVQRSPAMSWDRAADGLEKW